MQAPMLPLGRCMQVPYTNLSVCTVLKQNVLKNYFAELFLMYECVHRVDGNAESPLEQLQVALDATYAMHARFFNRYTVSSSVERRVGGQGLVQFGAIASTMDRVCSEISQCTTHTPDFTM